MRNILVLRGGGLGDFIVTLPALALLRGAWPEARIEIVGNRAAAVLGLGEGLLDAVHSQAEARWSRLYAEGPLPRETADWFDRFDLIVDYWPDPEGDLAKRFPSRAGQHHVCGTAKPERGPAAAHFCEPLRALGLVPGEPWYRLAGISAPRQSRRVAVHPGSGSAAKNWPLARWRLLCRHLVREEGAEIWVVAGEAEDPRILEEFGEGVRGATLPDVAAALASCGRFVGRDSGISHLAAACGTPCCLLFGPTDPAVWAPPTEAVRVVRKGPGLDAIEIADVLEGLASLDPLGTHCPRLEE